MPKTNFIFSCEHYSNIIPFHYESLFEGKKDILNTHFAWDIGIDKFITTWESRFQILCHKASISRLLVDLNRSSHHPNVFSSFTRPLSDLQKKSILNEYYFPYREKIENEVVASLNRNISVSHIAFHSFTPELHGEIRNCEIGVLYDPTSHLEKLFAKEFKNQLKAKYPKLRIRFNYPYLGIADSFPTYLRKKYGKDKYAGIELEFNQSLLLDKTGEGELKNLLPMIADTIHSSLLKVENHSTHRKFLSQG